MYAAPLNVILAVKPLKNILSENLQPVFLRLLLTLFMKADMEKRATHATQGRGNFYIIAEISSTIGAKWMFSIKTRPILCLKG